MHTAQGCSSSSSEWIRSIFLSWCNRHFHWCGCIRSTIYRRLRLFFSSHCLFILRGSFLCNSNSNRWSPCYWANCSDWPSSCSPELSYSSSIHVRSTCCSSFTLLPRFLSTNFESSSNRDDFAIFQLHVNPFRRLENHNFLSSFQYN